MTTSRMSLLVVLMIGCAGAGDTGGTAGSLVTDFESRRLPWITVNDDVMGGRSEGGFETVGGVLVFRGVTNTDGGGFSSIRTEPADLGLAGHGGIHLRVRGDGRTYRFRLGTEDPRAPYWAEFETSEGEWLEIRLPFDGFVPRWRGRPVDRPPIDPADIVSVGLMVFDRRDGPFRLEVDWIRAYGKLSLESLKWKRRPLVVFAPTEDDARLADQVGKVEAAKAGFEERDMALVVVAPGHGLSAEERDALGRRLGVEAGAFAVLLVGKDGTVKRRADEPVPMEELFVRIDGMPMRRREMEGE